LSEHSTTAFFDVWHTYRKVVAANYMHHMEIRAHIERVLRAQFASRPFSFLDLGCGDAAILAPLLASMVVQRYKGVDLSESALALAAENLTGLSCPVELVCRDILAALAADSALYDVVYTSFALHHLSTEQKAEFFRRVAQRLEKDGLLLLTDIVREEDESLPVYLRRYCDWLRSDWSALDAEEKASACDHILNNDRPETFSVLQTLAQAGGAGRRRSRGPVWLASRVILSAPWRGDITGSCNRPNRASAAGSRRATSNERDNAVGMIAKRFDRDA
jgi:SAM-dependent methyltransferase